MHGLLDHFAKPESSIKENIEIPPFHLRLCVECYSGVGGLISAMMLTHLNGGAPYHMGHMKPTRRKFMFQSGTSITIRFWRL